MRRLAVALCSAVIVAIAGGSASAQDAISPEVSPVQEEVLVVPDTTTTGETPPPEDVQEPPEEADPDAEAEAQAEADAGERPDWAAPGYGSAADRSNAAKVTEAASDCTAQRDPVSRMLAVGGTSEGGGAGPWVALAAAIAIGALAIAVGAFLVRRRRAAAQGRPTAPRGPLETVATIIAIFGGLTGLAVQFVPGIGVEQASSTGATMTVREVDARILHGEYVRKTGSDLKLTRMDQREVGNVVWLEIALKGYEGSRPVVQVGLHDPARGGALIDGTEKQVVLRAPEHADETLFVPVWVGYPGTDRFEAHFRLVEDGEVKQIASTGRMRASQYRYVCDRYVSRLARGG